MNRIIKGIGLFTIFGLALSCNNLEKQSNNDTSTELNMSSLSTTLSKSSTSKTTVSNDIYTKAAIETCNCIQPMIEKTKLLKIFELKKQTVEKKKIANEMDVMQPEIQKCSDEIRLKYGKMNKSFDEKRIMDAIIRQCPDASTLFSS